MKNKKKESAISVIDAIEALSSIVELDEELQGDINSYYENLGWELNESEEKNVGWLQEGNIDDTVERVKGIFGVILHYVEEVYKEESRYTQDSKTVEGVKNIMLLVGEAAKTIDRFAASIDKERDHVITNLPEFKKLQEFYRKKIDKKIDESVLGEWILGVAKKSLMRETVQDIKMRKLKILKRMFVDLDSVKSDGMYEILLMKKDDGERFFNSQLIRNMKLVCDFGGMTSTEERYDALKYLNYWRDRIANQAADAILHLTGNKIAEFYRHAADTRDHFSVANLNKAVIALMIASNPYNLKRRRSLKTTNDYFHDFQMYLREVLESRDYQRYLIYGDKGENNIVNIVSETAQAILEALFTSLKTLQQLLYNIDELLHEARQQAKGRSEIEKEGLRLWEHLANDYGAMLQLFKYHSNGPLLRDLEAMETDNIGFDSILQGNLPHIWFDLFFDGFNTQNLRLPSPTKQVFVDQADVTDEFKGLLFRYERAKTQKKHLIINFQDRTSWQGHARCSALEHIQKSSLFHDSLTVITLAMDTEFYHQVGPYKNKDNAKQFLEDFYMMLSKESEGCYFPTKIRDILFPTFGNKLLKTVHELFFGTKETLTHEERLSFISLVYTLITLKMIEIVKPSSFSLTCKDGVDTSSSANAVLFSFLKLINHEVLSEQALEYLNLMIYGPSILMRERTMRPEQFQRMLGVIKCLGECSEMSGFGLFNYEVHEKLGKLFDTSILKGHVEIL